MVVYYVDNSIHQIPCFIYITRKTGGVVLTTGTDSFSYIRNEFPDIEAEYVPDIAAAAARAAELRPRVMVHSDFTRELFLEAVPEALHVQTFHGTSDKVYHIRGRVRDYDLVLLPGPKMRDELARKNLLRRGHYKMVGYPKLDRVFLGEISGKDQLDRIRRKTGKDLKDGRPVVMYAPTWNDHMGNSSLPRFAREVILGAPDDVNLIVKLHPNTMRYDKIYPRLEEWVASKPNAALLGFEADPVPVMAAADLMVADISTVSHEFLAFDRPLVFLDGIWWRLWGKTRTWVWQAGDVVARRGKVWETVMRALDDPEKKGNLRRKLRDHIFHGLDGRAAERAAEAIVELGKKGYVDGK